MPHSTLPKSLAVFVLEADAGDGAAACKVGDAYYRGEGVAGDFLAALRWYERAAELGNTDGMTNLVYFYSKGDAARWGSQPAPEPPFPPDPATALKWAEAALAAGCPMENAIKALKKALKASTSEPKTKKVAPLQAFKQRLPELGLKRLQKPLLALLAPSLRLVLDPQAQVVSRLGGEPELPVGTPWPRDRSGPLSFVGQLDLAEVHAADPANPLPKAGLLAFFWNASRCCWGLDAGDGPSFQVLHLAPESVRVATSPPADLVQPGPYTRVRFASQPVRLVPELTLPFPRTTEFRGLKANDSEAEAYWQVFEALDATGRGGADPRHRVLGHADAIQGDMKRRIAYVLAGRFEAIDRDPPEPALEDEATGWRLLLQVDDDNVLYTAWGGRLFFWIRESDLAQGRFDKVWGQFQAS